MNPDEVHKLPINELLQRKAPQRSKAFIVEPECVSGADELHPCKCQPYPENRQRFGSDNRVDSGNVDDGGYQRKQNLERQQVWEASASELAGTASLANGTPVLPHGLHRPVAPAVSLLPQLPEGGWCLGPGPGGRCVGHTPSGPADRHSQVGVLGQSIVAETAHAFHGLTSKRPNGTRHRWHALPNVEQSTVKIEPADVLDVLPAAKQPTPVADLCVAGDGANVGCGKWRH